MEFAAPKQGGVLKIASRAVKEGAVKDFISVSVISNANNEL